MRFIQAIQDKENWECIQKTGRQEIFQHKNGTLIKTLFFNEKDISIYIDLPQIFTDFDGQEFKQYEERNFENIGIYNTKNTEVNFSDILRFLRLGTDIQYQKRIKDLYRYIEIAIPMMICHNEDNKFQKLHIEVQSKQKSQQENLKLDTQDGFSLRGTGGHLYTYERKDKLYDALAAITQYEIVCNKEKEKNKKNKNFFINTLSHHIFNPENEKSQTSHEEIEKLMWFDSYEIRQNKYD